MATDFTRPEWALEMLPAGALAARRQPASAQLQAASFVAFPAGASQVVFAPYVDKDAPRVPLPGIADSAVAQTGIVAAVKRALEETGARSGPITLVLPDTAVRVLMLDFDSIPDRASEALPVVRFRLRKLVPFEVDDAAVSYQVLSGEGTSNIRVLAAIIPNTVLRAYEDVVRAAGFEPGVVLPSTLAAMGLVADDSPALVVHATELYVTTAISRGNDLLLHRTHELPISGEAAVAAMPAAPAPPSAEQVREALEFLGEAPRDFDAPSGEGLAFVPSDDAEGSLFPAHIDPVADPLAATGYDAYLQSAEREAAIERGSEAEALQFVPVEDPDGDIIKPFVAVPDAQEDAGARPPLPVTHLPAVSERDEELINALTVAVAFYEDLAGRRPAPVRIAGTLDARAWQALMLGSDTAEENEYVLADLAGLENAGGAAISGISRAQLAAVFGALAG